MRRDIPDRGPSLPRAFFACAAIVLAGCASFANPIVAESGTSLDERLVGRWEGPVDEEEKIRFVVRRNGRMTVTFIDPESKPETEKARWVTADIDGLAIANVGLEVDGRIVWKPARYELTHPEELRIYPCDDDTWSGAINDGVLSGQAEHGHHGWLTFVSASVAELRDFVRTNRDAAFIDEPLVFQRKR
jgi:hypothetical protein